MALGMKLATPVTLRGVDGAPDAQLMFVTPLSALQPDFGEWWASDAALSLLHILDAETAPPAPRVERARVDDLLVAGSQGVKRRCVECADAADSGAAEAAMHGLAQEWHATDKTYYTTSEAVLLTHTFRWPAAADEAETEDVGLRTLVATQASDTLPLQAAVFGDAPLTLAAASGEARVACAVTRAGVSAEALAALSPLQRDALKQCRRAQVLSALAACVRRRWVGGVLLLRDVAVPLLRASAPHLQTLALRLRAALMLAPGGAPPTLDSCAERTRVAEALEAVGEFGTAAELYRANLADNMRVPGCVHSPPLVWQYFGLALKRNGDLAGARAAYERGLAVLHSTGSVVLPDTPEWRETLRLMLLSSLANILPSGERERALQCMFAAQMPQVGAHGCTVHDWRGTWLEGVENGRRWGLVLGENTADVQLYRIAELPTRTGPFVPQSPQELTVPPTGGLTLLCSIAPPSTLQLAALTPGGRDVRGAGAVPLPRLCGTCAACGTVRTGLKQCVNCGLVSYCSKEARASCVCHMCAQLHNVLTRALPLGPQCQKTDWKAHKPACRAAKASRQATA
jgi:hypothetical protein